MYDAVRATSRRTMRGSDEQESTARAEIERVLVTSPGDTVEEAVAMTRMTAATPSAAPAPRRPTT